MLICNLKHVKKTFLKGFVWNQLSFWAAGPKGSRGRLVDQNNDSSLFQTLSSFFPKPCFLSCCAGLRKIYSIDSAQILCEIKKCLSHLLWLITLEKREKNEIFFCKVRHFVNFSKFTKSLRQYLGNLIANNKVVSFFVSEDRSVLYLAHRLGLQTLRRSRFRFDYLFTNLITPLEQFM